MSKMNDQLDIRLINLENKFLKRFESFSEFREQTLIRLNSAQDEIKLLQIKDGERNVEIQTLQKQVSILKNLLDQYFTLEINQIKESHAKRKV